MDVTAIMLTILSTGLQPLTSECKNWRLLLNDSNPAMDNNPYCNVNQPCYQDWPLVSYLGFVQDMDYLYRQELLVTRKL
jgi:hypothetical protein